MFRQLAAAAVLTSGLAATATANAAGTCTFSLPIGCSGFTNTVDFYNFIKTTYFPIWSGTNQTFGFLQLALPNPLVITASVAVATSGQVSTFTTIGAGVNAFNGQSTSINEVFAVPGPAIGGLPVIAGMVAYGFYRRRRAVAA